MSELKGMVWGLAAACVAVAASLWVWARADAEARRSQPFNPQAQVPAAFTDWTLWDAQKLPPEMPCETFLGESLQAQSHFPLPIASLCQLDLNQVYRFRTSAGAEVWVVPGASEVADGMNGASIGGARIWGDSAGLTAWQAAPVTSVHPLSAAWHPRAAGITRLFESDGLLQSDWQSVTAQGSVTTVWNPEETRSTPLPAEWSGIAEFASSATARQTLTAIDVAVRPPANRIPGTRPFSDGHEAYFQSKEGLTLRVAHLLDTAGWSRIDRQRTIRISNASAGIVTMGSDSLIADWPEWAEKAWAALEARNEPWSSETAVHWRWQEDHTPTFAEHASGGREIWHGHTTSASVPVSERSSPSVPVSEQSSPSVPVPVLGEVRNHRSGKTMKVVWDRDGGRVNAMEGEERVWSVQLETGEIPLGEAFEIDLYKNRKYQAAWATNRRVQLIDVLGREVKGFPIVQQSGITAFLAADYDRKREYRFLVATADGKLRNYKEEGERTKGWNHTSSGSAIVHLAHIRVGSKDYIYAGESDGDVRLLQRSGPDRASTPVKVPSTSAPAFRVGSSIANTTVLFVDDDGWVREQRLGNAEDVGMSRMTRGVEVRAEDRTGDGRPEIVVTAEDGSESVWNARNEKL